jgi:hypothetical protein
VIGSEDVSPSPLEIRSVRLASRSGRSRLARARSTVSRGRASFRLVGRDCLSPLKGSHSVSDHAMNRQAAHGGPVEGIWFCRRKGSPDALRRASRNDVGGCLGACPGFRRWSARPSRGGLTGAAIRLRRTTSRRGSRLEDRGRRPDRLGRAEGDSCADRCKGLRSPWAIVGLQARSNVTGDPGGVDQPGNLSADQQRPDRKGRDREDEDNPGWLLAPVALPNCIKLVSRHALCSLPSPA